MRSPARHNARPSGRWWRGLSGSFAAGLLVLAVVVAGVALVALLNGAPGPGAFSLIGHLVAAVIALFAQRVVDRRRGTAAGVAAGVVFADVVAVLLVFWWL
ncbi:hypothetical protein [Amycolatopsis nigrescens]|uniref:hypothetical protein n=1 Tax=Amycolatopsis nigrescens TaxID=381445 RepID=UPI0003A88B54|nr:hypothetical protein [Amycolatopsis nigrescens]